MVRIRLMFKNDLVIKLDYIIERIFSKILRGCYSTKKETNKVFLFNI